MVGKEEIKKKIEEIETAMQGADFWNQKERAQASVRELSELKAGLLGAGKYDAGNAIVTVFSGAGGADAEDFSRILFATYAKYAEKKAWGLRILHKHENDHGGFRNLTFEISGTNAYGTLKNESGVHRLVRMSPFNARGARHTSFSLVEVIPELPKVADAAIPETELDVQFARSGGPGGQNVNKRETAVRIVHTPTNLSAHADSERSQQQNREKALQILKGKLYRKREEDRRKEEKGLSVSKTVNIEWGNQIRSYVLHPYKLVKDHRTETEVRDVDAVLGGELDAFIDAEKNLE